MDEAAVEKAGARRSSRFWTSSPALKTVPPRPAAGAGPAAPGRKCRDVFDVRSTRQDFADSSRVIAFASAGGLGLPDRDYYIKTDAKSQEIRAQAMSQHVAAHASSCWAIRRPPPKAEAQTVMEIETALAKASLTRVELRDPYKLFHKLNGRRLARRSRPPSTGTGIWTAIGLAAPAELNVTEPEFYQGGGTPARPRAASPTGRPTCAGTWRTPKRRTFRPRFVTANFDFYSKYLRGTTANAAALEALRALRGPQPRRGARPGVRRRRPSPPTPRRGALAMTKQIETAMETEINQPHVDGRGRPRSRRSTKLHAIVNKIGYPGQVARLQRARDHARRFSGQRRTRHRVRIAAPACTRSASPWTAANGR